MVDTRHNRAVIKPFRALRNLLPFHDKDTPPPALGEDGEIHDDDIHDKAVPDDLGYFPDGEGQVKKESPKKPAIPLIKGQKGRRDKNKFCYYHLEPGQDISSCSQLLDGLKVHTRNGAFLPCTRETNAVLVKTVPTETDNRMQPAFPPCRMLPP